ncbi:MAG: hypothetical protein ACYTDV_05780, partial [Planctomycetota bacterium]
MSNSESIRYYILLALAVTITGLLPIVAGAQTSPSKPKPEFPPLSEVTKDYTQVQVTPIGQRSYYTIWRRDKDGQMLAALPSGYNERRF